MDYEHECEEIKRIIIRERRKGRVKSWPDKLKRRILRLCEVGGVARTASVIDVNAPMISRWKSELPAVENCSLEESTSLSVTRVSVAAATDKIGVAVLECANSRMVFHSDELAVAVARALLGRGS
jgi:transposase-like protein